ncbi:TylF/MycF/NovP-related O-methyltransferase [Flexivirga caeni]|uniref:Class I SAM-dependent methyltransferase n=1 Tax=Flexivirga caeni TaxID=2294115 RepID=A0A3M9M7P2_9MICO|nr:TylF/MycF/NovP-related O-methyltransferase [Flexivirga caeni]RNI21594.1 class I SAM-dependent methyltransferase [Flexivirga caeni]
MTESSTDELLRQLVKQVRTTREVPSTALGLRQAAVQDSVDHIRADRRFADAQVHQHNPAALLRAASVAPDFAGLIAEFGVHKGASLTLLADHFPDQLVHGFDSFEGLPEAWTGSREGAGAFDVGGEPPQLPVTNVEFHVGWFEDTVPAFAATTTEPLRLAHLDADLYSSTTTVFEALGDRFIPGTVVIFDEYFGYHGWRQHEHRAFSEFLAARPDLDFDAVAIGHMNLAVRLRAR